jgi:hypothetical protein
LIYSSNIEGDARPKRGKMKTDRFGILLIVIIVLLLFALAMTARAREMKSSDTSQLSGGAKIQNQPHRR